jgi:hypothetical protein
MNPTKNMRDELEALAKKYENIPHEGGSGPASVDARHLYSDLISILRTAPVQPAGLRDEAIHLLRIIVKGRSGFDDLMKFHAEASAVLEKLDSVQPPQQGETP